MATLLLTHPSSLEHDTGRGHPERADRLRAIGHALEHEHFAALVRREAPRAPLESIVRVHSEQYVEALREAEPAAGEPLVHLDADTVMSHGSFEAALRAAGAAVHAVDQVMTGAVRNAFCAMRPPGHHAESRRPMGFCLFSNAAIAAKHARATHGAERVAVVDFDVHHGNGTQEVFWNEQNLFYGSTHQMPLYPGTGAATETGAFGTICNAPLRSGDGGRQFRAAMTERIIPALEAFRPDLLIISAGFDAHRDDPLGGLALTEEDFAWVTEKLVDTAARQCNGRVVSVLEGGYDLAALAQSVAVHVAVLMAAAS